MRALIGASVLMVAFLIISIWVTQATLEQVSFFRNEFIDLREKISAENWDHAQKQIVAIHKKWNQTQDYWDFYILHNDIENVEIMFARLGSFIASEDVTNSLGELAALDMQFSHIYRNEMFNLQNVL